MEYQDNIAQVEKWLNELAAVREQMASVAENYDKAIAELQAQKAEAIGDELPAVERELTKFIKAETAFIGSTVKGNGFNGFQAVWSKGRTSWDTTELVSLIPEVKDEELKQRFSACQKTGEPSVSIRVVKVAKKVEEAGSLF